MTPELDARTRKNLLTLDPKARQAFADFSLSAAVVASQYGCSYRMIGGNRTYAAQDALYAQGRSAAGPKVTNARAGYSNHNFGIAADYGVFRGRTYLDESDPLMANKIHLACAALAEQFGLSAGAYWESFPDLPHYEIATTLTLAQKRARFNQSGSVLP